MTEPQSPLRLRIIATYDPPREGFVSLRGAFSSTKDQTVTRQFTYPSVVSPDTPDADMRFMDCTEWGLYELTDEDRKAALTNIYAYVANVLEFETNPDFARLKSVRAIAPDNNGIGYVYDRKKSVKDVQKSASKALASIVNDALMSRGITLDTAPQHEKSTNHKPDDLNLAPV